MTTINTFVIDGNKHIYTTVWRPIHQGENRCDDMQFLINPNFFDSIDDCKCLLQLILPKLDESNKETLVGKLRYLTIEDELYKAHYRMSMPITSALTEYSGEVKMWLTFFNTESNKLIKTNITSFYVHPSETSSTTIDDDNGSYDVVTQLQSQIDDLYKNKADALVYELEDNTLQLSSEGELIDHAVQLSGGVSWDWIED